MSEASCHCGAVTLGLAAPPATVTDCNCSICRRYGVLWAYYTPGEVTVFGSTEPYGWGPRTIVFHRCVTCGCVTHWSPVDPARDKMGSTPACCRPECWPLRGSAISTVRRPKSIWTEAIGAQAPR